MSAVENFDADAVEVSDEVSCTFTLNGEQWSCRNRDQVSAVMVNSAFSGALTDLQFIQAVLVPEDRERFAVNLPREDFPFGVKQQQMLTQFLIEQILNRPTVPLGSSGPGRQSTKATSAGSSSSRATRRARSAS